MRLGAPQRDSAGIRVSIARDPRPRRTPWAAPGSFIAVALALLVVLAPLAIGAVHASARAALQASLYLLSLSWMLQRTLHNPDQPSPAAFRAAAVALCLYLGFQVAPLPADWLARLSPAAIDLRHYGVDVLAKTAAPGPAGPAADRQIAERAAEAERKYLAPPTLALDRLEAERDLLCYIGLGLALWLAATLPEPELLLRASVVAGVIVSGLAIVQNATWNGKILWFFRPYDGGTYYPRLTGPFVNADHFALFLELTLFQAAALLAGVLRRSARSARRRREVLPDALSIGALAVAIAMMLAGLIGSASRGGIVGAVLGGLYFWWAIRRLPSARTAARSSSAPDDRPLRPKRRGDRLERLAHVVGRFAPATLAIAVVIGGLLYAGSEARGLLDVRLGQSMLAPDLELRVNHWRQTLPIIGDFPLFGVGLKGWRQAFGHYQHYPLIGRQASYAHNDYLEWVAEVGLVGILLTLALAFTYVRWVRSRRSLSPQAFVGICASLVAVGWHEFFDFGLRMPANALLLCVLLGLLCNPNWSRHRAAPIAQAEGAPPSIAWQRVVMCSAVTPLIALLCYASINQFREFMQWLSVRNGSIDLAFAPSNAETWYELGKRLTERGSDRAVPARACFRAAIAERPTFGWAYWRLAATEADDARKLEILDAAVYLQPTQAEWRLSKAALLDRAGDSQAALAEVVEAVYRAPLLMHHPYLRPDNTRLSAPMLDAADRGFRRALAEQPDDVTLLNEVASFDYRFGAWGEAAELWMRAANATGKLETYGLRAAESFAEKGDYARAEELARKAIAEKPSEAEAYRLLAMSVLRPQRRFIEARGALELGTHRSKRPADLYVALYTLEREQGNTAAALAAFAKAADLRRTDAMMQFYLGVAYVDAGDNHRSVIALDHAIAIDNRQPQFYFYKGIALERRLDLKGALENYRAAASRDSKNPIYSDSVARVAKAMR